MTDTTQTQHPTTAGPLEQLLNEYRRRGKLVCENAAGTGKDIEPEHTDWIDETRRSARSIRPDTAREVAAKVLLMTLNGTTIDDGSPYSASLRKDLLSLTEDPRAVG
ncbi:hypothetical protein KHP62_02385 [Rhodobacteraceae bacterium NNCM2]|nr:hypothetical protein [Coraliihabitans acroporae]